MNQDLETVRDDVKRTVTMDEVLRILGITPPHGNNRKINSPFNPADRTPSCHLYDYDWYDYSTGQGGDQITFVQEFLGVSYLQALQVLGRGMPMAVMPRERHTNDMPWEPPDLTRRFEEEPEGDWDQYEAWEAYAKEKWAYLAWIDILSMHNKVSAEGELWTPHYVPDDSGKLVVRGVKIRKLDGSKYSLKTSQFIVGLYRPRPWAKPTTHALVVEGESDAWVMAKMLAGRDVTVFGLPSGAGTIKERFLDELRKFETVTIGFDDDEPGRDATAYLATNLFDGKVHRLQMVVPLEIPGGRIAEAAAAGWTI